VRLARQILANGLCICALALSLLWVVEVDTRFIGHAAMYLALAYLVAPSAEGD